jgi:hypothetical protein
MQCHLYGCSFRAFCLNAFVSLVNLRECIPAFRLLRSANDVLMYEVFTAPLNGLYAPFGALHGLAPPVSMH